MKFALVFLSSFILLATLDVSESLSDQALVVCPTKPKVVYTTDGNLCFPIRNTCYMDSENARRKLQGQRPLWKIGRLACKRLCNTMCIQEVKPVCGELDGKYAQFTNECEMTNHVCQTGQTYIKTDPANCGIQQSFFAY